MIWRQQWVEFQALLLTSTGWNGDVLTCREITIRGLNQRFEKNDSFCDSAWLKPCYMVVPQLMVKHEA